MTQQEVKTLEPCSTAHECLYELSNKIRYMQLTYGKDRTAPDSDSPEPPRLSKITIDMGRYSDAWHQQLQMILGSSYRLTHDYTDETMNAFLAKKLEELNAGYEDGQVVLKVVRRQFGNMILKVVYQNRTLAAEFIRQTHTPLQSIP
jgi:FMN phosphatase YigB (HAD superfamily)